jgi:molybdate transport repressor ModE-like protein
VLATDLVDLGRSFEMDSASPFILLFRGIGNSSLGLPWSFYKMRRMRPGRARCRVRAGSFKQAASDLGKSYRYIWGRIKEAERVLGQQLVETRVGGCARGGWRRTPSRVATSSRIKDCVTKAARHPAFKIH